MTGKGMGISLFLVGCAAWASVGCGQELGSPPRLTEPSAFDVELPSRQTTLSLKVNTRNRFEVQVFFQQRYKASIGVPIGWSGSIAGCDPGTTSGAYKEATILRVNYYRAMAGLPADVTLDADWNAKCQAAALMMSAENDLSHYPDSSWACYSEDGAEAAGNSDLAGGNMGPDAIDGYIKDPGEENYFVGHRRWVLFPAQKVMGTGSVPSSIVNQTYHWSANALWVVYGFGGRPPTPEWVAWPPEGYVPYQLVYPRWSFSYHHAGFDGASVTMSKSGEPIPLTVLSLDKNDIGYADNTIVWEPLGLPSGTPQADITYTVRISNVLVRGTPRDFEYDVTVMNPDFPAPSIQVTDIETSQGNAVTITFMDSGTGASGYELESRTVLPGSGGWVTDASALITDLGAGVLEANTTSLPTAKARFYRLKLTP